jgi:hypothetical protein
MDFEKGWVSHLFVVKKNLLLKVFKQKGQMIACVKPKIVAYTKLKNLHWFCMSVGET